MRQIETIIKKKIIELSLQGKLEGKSIYLFGHNLYTEYINNLLYEEGYRLCGIVDNDQKKLGRCIINIPIIAPESVNWGENTVCLTATKYAESMAEQLHQFSEEIQFFILVDWIQWREQWEKKEKFWLEENYETEVMKLCLGAEVYGRLKQEEQLLILPFPAMGDAFLVGVYLSANQSLQSQNLKVIVCSKGAFKVMQMYGVVSETILEQEQEALYKFICFCMDKKQDKVMFSWIYAFEVMAGFKKLSFTQFIARFFLRLGNNCPKHFPCIWDKEMKESEFMEKGLVKGKSVILSPYANSISELPWQFWECLTEKLQKNNFSVFTNIVGKQKPVKNSKGLEIPLDQLGSYLEYAGYFIALRSGLCDIVGRALCRQIVIFRDGYIPYFDLHSEEISENAIQYVYDDSDLYVNIDKVLKQCCFSNE